MRNTKTNMQFCLGKLGNTLLEKRQLDKDVQRAKKQSLQKYKGVTPQAGRVDQTKFLQLNMSENSQKDLEARAKMGKIWADEFREQVQQRKADQIKSLQWFENEKSLKTFHNDYVSCGFSYYYEKKWDRRKHKNRREETLPKASASLDNQCGQGDGPMINSEDSQHLQSFVLNNWKTEVTIKWFHYF